MANYNLKYLTFSFILIMLPIQTFADSEQSFINICLEAWMKNLDKSVNKVDYKNFGEIYCACASKQPISNKEDIKKAARLCMSRTILHNAMDALEEEVGLTEATKDNVSEYCSDTWTLVYPKPSEDEKAFIKSYCTCTQTKLYNLNQQSEKVTDKEYDEAIDSIALSCSDELKAAQ